MSQNLPVFVEIDPDVIMAESKARLEEILGRELQPAQVEQLMLQFIVYEEVLINSRFNAGMRQMLYQFSAAPVLDYIAALVSVERLPALAAGCTVRFTLVEGHGVVLIPEGTRVATSDGEAIFETVADAVVQSDVNSIDLKVEAQVAGKTANGYQPGTVNSILDPLAFVSKVENLDLTGGGSDVETDEQLRERIKLAPSQYSTAGSHESYLFHAKSANPLITDISVTSPIPGTVQLVPLTDYEETPVKVIEDVYRVCSDEKVRPLTDTVIVVAPTRVDYTVEVNITLYENADATESKKAITEALEALTAEKDAKLGKDIIRSHIAQKCRIEQTYDVAVISPVVNIVITPEQVGRCTGITVTITGFNRG